MKVFSGRRSAVFLLLLLVVGLVLVGCSSESAEPESADPVEIESAETAVSPTQEPAPEEPASGVPAPDGIVDVVWEWEVLKNRDPENSRAYIITEIPNPENYTLIMRQDGTFSGMADCNQISGTYTTEGGYFFTFGTSTMAACGDDSMNQKYIDLLNNVVTGGPNGAVFALEAAGGSDRMEFRNGGAAPAQ